MVLTSRSRHLLVIFLVLFILCPQAFAEGLWLFHWGWPEVNAEILAAGKDVGEGKRLLDQSMMAVIIKHAQKGEAGAGLYLSDQAAQTENYGKQLLIFEAPKSKSFPTVDKYKLQMGFPGVEGSGLPAISRFTPDWDVVSRAPDSGLNITLHVATAADVDNYWSQPRDRDVTLTELGNMGRIAQDSTVDKGSLDFVKGVLERHGYDFIMNVSESSLTSNLMKLEDIYNGFKTTHLSQDQLEAFHNRILKAQQPGVISCIGSLFKRVGI